MQAKLFSCLCHSNITKQQRPSHHQILSIYNSFSTVFTYFDIEKTRNLKKRRITTTTTYSIGKKRKNEKNTTVTTIFNTTKSRKDNHNKKNNDNNWCVVLCWNGVVGRSIDGRLNAVYSRGWLPTQVPTPSLNASLTRGFDTYEQSVYNNEAPTPICNYW